MIIYTYYISIYFVFVTISFCLLLTVLRTLYNKHCGFLLNVTVNLCNDDLSAFLNVPLIKFCVHFGIFGVSVFCHTFFSYFLIFLLLILYLLPQPWVKKTVSVIKILLNVSNLHLIFLC